MDISKNKKWSFFVNGFGEVPNKWGEDRAKETMVKERGREREEKTFF